MELLLELLWSKTLSAPSFGRYQIEMKWKIEGRLYDYLQIPAVWFQPVTKEDSLKWPHIKIFLFGCHKKLTRKLPPVNNCNNAYHWKSLLCQEELYLQNWGGQFVAWPWENLSENLCCIAVVIFEIWTLGYIENLRRSLNSWFSIKLKAKLITCKGW